MENNRAIEEIMLGMVYEKAREIYSEALIEHGTNPRNYGAIDHPDGYAKITGPCGDTVEIFLRVARYYLPVQERCSCKTMPACIGINQSAIVKHLEKMPADHEHCALLAAMTFQKALRQCIEGVKKD